MAVYIREMASRRVHGLGLRLLLVCGLAASCTANAAPPASPAPSGKHADADDEHRLAAAAALLEHEAIGGVRMGMTQADVVALLGEPSWQGKRNAESSGGFSLEWYWKHLETAILFFGADAMAPMTVRGVKVVGPSPLETAKGVGIGSSRREVEAAYAAGHARGREDYVVGGDEGLTFSFTLDTGTVDAIYWGLDFGS
ncbi:hypothetical protein [Polyangium sp. y55x31]|uniref:hypothetical protein n=1 Tax=Polyangium sp. y55x31 TaxID=3042688 RepID=UPI00248265C4|nr:hypothetical protein [Polyangium sp. y55x31]MDI1480328.1 hypothetical protein [Polyangium sp. y55x31]